MYLVFTHMRGESYRRRLRSLLLCLCYVFRALMNFCVCWRLAYFTPMLKTYPRPSVYLSLHSYVKHRHVVHSNVGDLKLIYEMVTSGCNQQPPWRHAKGRLCAQCLLYLACLENETDLRLKHSLRHTHTHTHTHLSLIHISEPTRPP